MKFSWKLLNYFINLKEVNVNYFKEQLTLSGIEIDEITQKDKNNDKCIKLNLTSNRKDIFSILNLAKETSSIFNIPLIIKPIHSYTKYTHKQILNTYHNIFYINRINNIEKHESPSWLVNYLKTCEIRQKHLIYDLQEYIKLKWGYNFYIIDYINLTKELLKINLSIKHSNFISNYINKIDNTKFIKHKSKILIFVAYENDKKQEESYTPTDYFINAYNETLNIISTYTKATVGKLNHHHKKNQESNKQIKLYKHKINTILGPVNQKTLKFLSKKNIQHILNSLNLYTKYDKNIKLFYVNIPKYRKHDIQRNIDLIEEIGRIYGFKHFIDKIPISKRKGNISYKELYIKSIRKILRHLGMHEVVNCSLVNNINTNTIQIYNPINKEQIKLRDNITKTLINNYYYNIKHKNFRTEIFEIGKVFKQNINNKNIERKHLGCLISNNNFTRKEWFTTPDKINWSNAKGFLENFLEQLNANVKLTKILNSNLNKSIEDIKNFFHPTKRLGIYDYSNTKLIGILGELNQNISKEKVYIFEIDINELYKTIISNQHLNHTIKQYSNYPCVTRDISIKINKYKAVGKIFKIIQKLNNELIESIEVFNEYYENQYKTRSVGLRLTYRANNRTLNKSDINSIDLNIKNLLSDLENI
uniref:phenylalanine--tRNA ligase n=1 Tax=Cliftonaea pectinata TaxID=2007206 RepID=A0A1Z1MQE6_9FLOR|nr:Phenylalanine-tRNA ligase beta subunit [Cliftonaea pectinata]ARW67991.1 Phenylalanine-tRNA ligase beta subunit [Cliftonaea pectinata]